MVKSYQNVYKFCSAEHLEYFRNFLNGPHGNMPFTIENEKENRAHNKDHNRAHCRVHTETYKRHLK